MLNSICREEKDYPCQFQHYIALERISDDDREILNKLEEYISNEATTYYSNAIANYTYNETIITKNQEIVGNNYGTFWEKHKSVLKGMLEDSKECPVCGLSYLDLFNYEKSIEHVFPKSEYQQYILSPINLVYFCNVCNRKKSDKVNGCKIFHPLFSEIECCSEPIIKFCLRKKFKVEIEVKIDESNNDYFYFINDVFQLHKRYRNFIMQFINIAISSIENNTKGILKGLSLEDKYEKLSQFINESFFKVFPDYILKTETEKMIVIKLKNAIKNQPKLFARYIIDESSILKIV